MGKYEDPRDAAQFHSLWDVVVHASGPEDDREILYDTAAAAMVEDHRWREYIMVFTPKRHLHVGYRYANPKDWFLLDANGGIDGPFKAKRHALKKIRAQKSATVGPGVYTAKVDGAEYTLFTRDRAEGLGLKQEELP